ncbi:MAG: hypothetical protein H7A46_00935 [Verrucomicrobiales bacterium]|nr:hypothetical protein [Verrucomicrobiales bacterium]
MADDTAEPTGFEAWVGTSALTPPFVEPMLPSCAALVLGRLFILWAVEG